MTTYVVKFDLRQKVVILHNGKVHEGSIQRIEIHDYFLNKGSCVKYEINVPMCGDSFNVDRTEENVFATKAELLESL